MGLRPVSCPFRARTPQKRKRAGRADQRRQATNTKSDQAQTQSDSHQQATGTAESKLWKSNFETTPLDSVPFSSTRTIVRASNVRPDIPPTARHGESWNVMTRGTDGDAPGDQIGRRETGRSGRMVLSQWLEAIFCTLSQVRQGGGPCGSGGSGSETYQCVSDAGPSSWIAACISA